VLSRHSRLAGVDPELALLKRVAQRDPRAIRVLAHRLVGRSQRLVQRLLGDHADNSQVVLRVMIELIHDAASCAQPVRIDSWADQITARTALTAARKRQRRTWLGRAAGAPKRKPAAERGQQASSDTAPQLDDCLARLSPLERQIVVLRHGLDLAPDRIAHMTETSHAAACDTLLAARASLRRMLAPTCRERGAQSASNLRFIDASDRAALGETLAPEELAFCEAFAASHLHAQREVALFNELSHHDADPDEASRAIVDAVLLRLADEAAQAEQDEVTRIKTKPRGPGLWWACSAAATAAIALAFVLFPAPPKNPRVTLPLAPAPRIQLIYAAGEVQIDGQAARPDAMLIAEGGTLEVMRGTACVALDPGIALCAGSGTRLRLSQTHGLWRRFDLERGIVGVQLPLQPNGWRLSIVAGGVWATSQGASFSVETDPAFGVRATNLNGQLSLGIDGSRPLELVAHQSLGVQHGRSGLEPANAGEESRVVSLLEPATAWRKPLGATLDLRGLPVDAEVWLDDRMIGLAPLLARVPPGAHALQVRAGYRTLAALGFTAEIGKLTALSVDP
jgi:DNA-directed RNA polymerase specialized sigma24 family protein